MDSREAKRQQAAKLVADSKQTKQTVPEIAAAVGCSPRTINDWKNEPEFRAMVDQIRNAWRTKANSRGIADVDFVYRNLQDRHVRLRAIIEHRAKNPALRKAPGGCTGLLTVTYKMRSLGDGLGQEKIPEYSLDTGLLEELRQIEVQMQTHLGNWKRRIEYVDSEPKQAPAQLAVTVTFVNVAQSEQPGHPDQCAVPGQISIPIPAPSL